MVGWSVGGLDRHDELHVVAVLAVLLRICRDHAAALDARLQRAILDDTDREPYLGDAIDAMMLDAPAIDPEYLAADELRELAALLRAAPDAGDLAWRARDAATAIDEHRGAHLFGWFASRSIACGADDPVPIAPAEAVADELGTTRGLVPPPDRLTWCSSATRPSNPAGTPRSSPDRS